MYMDAVVGSIKDPITYKNINSNLRAMCNRGDFVDKSSPAVVEEVAVRDKSSNIVVGEDDIKGR